MYETPGPGTYDSQSNLGAGAPAYSLHDRINEKNRNQNPGPGTYESDQFKSVRSKSPAYSMSASFSKRAPEDFPGPGTYEGKFAFGKNSAPSYSFAFGDFPAIE